MVDSSENTSNSEHLAIGEQATFEQQFGQAIENERVRRGWTADEAARRAGVAPKTWQRIEDGKPVRALTLRHVDDVFGLPRGTAQQSWQRGEDIGSELPPRGLGKGLASLIPPAKPSTPEQQFREAQRIVTALPTDHLYRLLGMIELIVATREMDKIQQEYEEALHRLNAVRVRYERLHDMWQSIKTFNDGGTVVHEGQQFIDKELEHVREELDAANVDVAQKTDRLSRANQARTVFQSKLSEIETEDGSG